MNLILGKLRPASRPVLGKARPADAEAVGQILSDWIDETPWISRSRKREDEQAFARELVDHGWVTVARRHGRVAGFLARDGDDVLALYVAGYARGQGVGSALIDRAKRKSRRLSLWTFQFNHAARAFYQGHGFCEVERTGGAGNDEKLPDIRFEWEKSR